MTKSTNRDSMGRKVCIVTGTRADWGLLSPLARALDSRPDIELSIVATNMHLLPEYGETWREIEADGLKIDRRVPMEAPDDTPRGTVKAMGMCMSGMADALSDLSPDLIVILGDRYEMLVAASAALIFRIPVAHIAGGAVSLGAFDESIRHAITKLSHIHLVETEEYRRRVIQLGEQPDRVINTGAIGLHNIASIQLMSRDELEQSLGTTIPDKTLLVTFHPATLDSQAPADQCRNLLEALDRYPDYKVIFTYPNNDTHGRDIISLINRYAADHPERVAVFRSLGMRRYLSALRYVTAVVGNSSSGIVEVPSAGIPTLDIGLRQHGRIAADSVIHCGVSADEISRGLRSALSPHMRMTARQAVNPYYRPDTLCLMVNAIAETPLDGITIKPFHDL
ncbi:MAG: UDP-N-acetylglucosamine 2-epimerase [Pseudoflavonifractor sp.]|nr:UDP-N-acetylglucosamine 2-epimerase [Pseudoflavonifractor sp.]